MKSLHRPVIDSLPITAHDNTMRLLQHSINKVGVYNKAGSVLNPPNSPNCNIWLAPLCHDKPAKLFQSLREPPRVKEEEKNDSVP